MEKGKYSYMKDFFQNNFDKNTRKNIIYSLCIKICDQIMLEYILSTIKSEDHESNGSGMPYSDLLFFDYIKYKNVSRPKEEEIDIHDVSLKNNGFLIHTAERKELALSFIKFNDGNDKLENNSYEIIKVKPFNIYYVVGRNDHITFGKYLNKDANLQCKKVIDFSQLLKECNYNGKHFIDKNNNELNEPFLKEHIDLFFLGKLLIEFEEDSGS